MPGSFEDVGEGGLVGDSFDMVRIAKNWEDARKMASGTSEIKRSTGLSG